MGQAHAGIRYTEINKTISANLINLLTSVTTAVTCYCTVCFSVHSNASVSSRCQHTLVLIIQLLMYLMMSPPNLNYTVEIDLRKTDDQQHDLSYFHSNTLFYYFQRLHFTVSWPFMICSPHIILGITFLLQKVLQSKFQ